MDNLISVVTNYMASSFTSTFIFGILTGWLIEWLFYNFFWKNRKNSNQAEKATIEPEITKSKDKPAKKETEAVKKEPVEKQSKKPKEQPTKADVVESEQQQRIVKSTKPDNLTKLLGIGPSMSKFLNKVGINSFKQLSESSTEELAEKLIAKGARINNKGIMESWAKQAKLADANNFDALKALQNKLKK